MTSLPGLPARSNLYIAKECLRNQQLTYIVLAEQTAYPIKGMLQAMVAEVTQPDDLERSIRDRIFLRVQDLIDHRNQLLHSFNVVGATDGDQEFVADGYKLSETAASMEFRG